MMPNKSFNSDASQAGADLSVMSQNGVGHETSGL